jgi:hypothetical protein
MLFVSELDTDAGVVWSHATRMEGVNAELAPWVRMSVPRTARGLTIDAAPTDRVAFHSWLLALGFLPFDRHALRLSRVEPGRGFEERSASWLEREWNHDRTIEPLGPGRCRVTDRITFVPRIAIAAPLVRAIVRATFERRHARLRAIFGGHPA